MLLIHPPDGRELKAGRYLIKRQQAQLLKSLQQLTGLSAISLMKYGNDLEDVDGLFLFLYDPHPSLPGLQFYAQAVDQELARLESEAKKSSPRATRRSMCQRDISTAVFRSVLRYNHLRSKRPMKTLTKELWMEVSQRRAIVSIHDEVEQLVEESGVQDGMVLVNAMHRWGTQAGPAEKG